MRTVRLLVLIGAACATAPGWVADVAGAPPQNVVVGTGEPNLDVAAVQAAVDQGGQVVLRGHFSFDQPPTKSTPPQAFFPRIASVLVSKEVVISGSRDERDQMTSIDGGTWPFAVEASGVHITIQGLRFVRPKAGAIEVNAVSGLMISGCRIEGVEPLPNQDLKGARVGMGIGISTTSKPPTRTKPEQPENVSGILSIDSLDRLYVLEMSAGAGGPGPGQGMVLRVEYNGHLTTIASGLTFPTAMTFSPDGTTLYITNFGFGFPPGAGQVVSIPVTN
jgi:hypothetical protein